MSILIMAGICIAVTGAAFAVYTLIFIGPVLALDGVLLRSPSNSSGRVWAGC